MDPAKPACEACGTTEGELYQSAHAGWLCKDVTACYARIDASGATVAGRLLATYGMDPLHPTGRCTCGGEGRCAWCQEICQSCGGCFDEFGCRACNNTGYADGLSLSEEERAAKVAAIRAEECDYEALGYRETMVRHDDLRTLGGFLDRMMGALLGDYERIGCADLDIQKDIRSDTDSG